MKRNSNNSIFNNIIITALLLLAATALSFLIYYLTPSENVNVDIIYILALVLVGRYTTGYIPGLIASIVSVICINYLFTYPFFALNFTITGYPLTFLVMFSISLITSTTTTHLKKQGIALAEKEKIIMEAEKEKMRATLLRSISHDLRTPLTSIIGASSSLNNKTFNLSENEQTQLISNISEDAHWLLNMVENILSVTKIQNENATLKKTPEALEEVLSESVMRVKKRIPTAEINIELPQEFILIPMDALLIEQVIINLLENALIHSHTKQSIELYTTIKSDLVTVHIKDYGIGISLDDCDDIFDFYTNKNSSDSEKGFGIGLSICKTIILAHKGEIHAKNHKHGSEFYFSLPREV